MSQFFFNKVLIFGIGLIGGSIAKTLKKHQISQEIWAYDQDIEAINLAKNQGIINGFCLIDKTIQEFDLIIISTPLSTYSKIFFELNKFLLAENLVIDLGSIKNFKIDLIKKLPNFIGCHPIAGSEKTGYIHAEENLFANKKFIICQYSNFQDKQKNSLEKLKKTILKIQAIPEILDPKLHDQIYALTSHLPQFLSFLTKQFSPKKIDDDFFKSCFRLDNSNPIIWQEIFKLNQANLEFFYKIFFQNLLEDFDNIDKINFKQHQTLINNFDCKLSVINNNFLVENFSEIFIRYLVVINYLKIEQLKNFLNYTGKGFDDFIKIASILSIDHQELEKLLKNNLLKIKKYFNIFFK